MKAGNFFKKKVFPSAFLMLFAAVCVFAQDGYVFSSASNDDNFKAFDMRVNSYENALMLVVQTYETSGRLQTVEDVKITIRNLSSDEIIEQIIKTPYLYVFADYKTFKNKYDFATSNGKTNMMKENPDSSYVITVEADLAARREIQIFVIEGKKILSSQTGKTFPFVFASACNVKYSEAIKDVDKSINNSGLNDWKDYIGGPKVIKR
jgi:hypothetical protein